MKAKFITCISLLMVLIACSDDTTDDATKDISLNFKLQYEGEPLVMLDEYTFPSGEIIKFTRFSFYISNLSIASDTIELKDVDLINLSRSHSSLSNAEQGFSYMINGVPDKKDQILTMLLGVGADLNTNVPSNFTGDHPLSNSGEYWIAWDSYIFFKIEGIVDLDGDGETETNVALHIGSDQAARQVDIQIDNSNNTDITIDVSSIFQDQNSVFDIVKNPQIHSLSQIDQANFLMDNFSKQLNL